MIGLGARHIVLVLAALLLVWAAVQMTGVGPGSAAQGFVEGSVGGPAAWRKTLREMTPLLIAGLAVFVAFRAGLFNIGADGQLVVGAVAAAAVALNLPGPLGMGLACVTAAIAGALWAFPAGWIKAYRGGHEVISTIMLNNIALSLSGWLAVGRREPLRPRRDAGRLDQPRCQPARRPADHGRERDVRSPDTDLDR